MGEGWRLVSGGTDNHLMLVDVFARGITGKVAEAALDRAGITVNKNTIPFDTNSPMVASGIRVGTPALTTRGMKEAEMEEVGRLIARALAAVENETGAGRRASATCASSASASRSTPRASRTTTALAGRARLSAAVRGERR